MPTSFIVKNKRAVVAITAVLLMLVSLAYYFAVESAHLRSQVEKTREALALNKEALVFTLNYESDYRAFVASADEELFQKKSSETKIARETPVSALQILTAQNGENSTIVRELADVQRALASQPISRETLGNLSRKELSQELARREELLDRYRKANARLSAKEQKVLIEQRSKVQLYRDLFYWAFGALSFGCLSGLFWLSRAIDQYLKEKNEAVTILQRKTDDLQRAKDEAVRANLLKSQFVANISHEIRTPMNGILGLSELLAESETDSDGIAKHIHDSALSLMNILNDLLDFSKLEAGRMQLNPTQFNVAELIKDVCDLMAVNFASQHLSLESAVEPPLNDYFIGDCDRIRQVLLNLVHNALKFTTTGKVTVNAKIDRTHDEDAFVRFEVIDTGVGIDEMTQKQLFQPFTQADMSSTRRHGGTGLGLSISKSLVELMNGIIDCESEVGKGSTFSFVVPLEMVKKAADIEPTPAG
ncbi:MAG TPA: ATP-binding protein [Oculatellaceae cyanobacterium]